MKVFISADIEGTTLTTLWDECYPQKMPATSAAAGRQMTLEVKAACEGAIAAGADEIVVKDAHASGTNIDITQLPSCVRTVRGSAGSPWSMVLGIDESFDAAMFIGYHCAAGRCGNPLSHTETRATTSVRLNGEVCSEFMLYSRAVALVGVPSVFLSGDEMLIEDSKALHPMLKTVAVKSGFGGSTCCIHPSFACRLIREGAESALRQDLSRALCTLPDSFTFEVSYKEVKDAVAMSYFPGFELVSDNTIRMCTGSYWEVLRAVTFVL